MTFVRVGSESFDPSNVMPGRPENEVAEYAGRCADVAWVASLALPDLSAQVLTAPPLAVMVAGSLASSQSAGDTLAGDQPPVLIAEGPVPAEFVAVTLAV
jgi:hypothetical protein